MRATWFSAAPSRAGDVLLLRRAAGVDGRQQRRHRFGVGAGAGSAQHRRAVHIVGDDDVHAAPAFVGRLGRVLVDPLVWLAVSLLVSGGKRALGSSVGMWGSSSRLVAVEMAVMAPPDVGVGSAWPLNSRVACAGCIAPCPGSRPSRTVRHFSVRSESRPCNQIAPQCDTSLTRRGRNYLHSGLPTIGP